jgi:hypothetical protein
LGKQASIFATKSSHSGTPILSPLLAVVVVAGLLVVVVVALAGLLVVVVLVVVVALLVEDVLSDLLQAANSSAQETESIRGTKIFFSIYFSLKFRLSLRPTKPSAKVWESAGTIHKI